MSIISEKVKTTDMSNNILESLNRFHDAKLTGTVTEKEFPEMISKVWMLFVNNLKHGKVSSGEIESMEALLPGKGANEYFTIKHKGLEEVTATAKKSVYIALVAKERAIAEASAIPTITIPEPEEEIGFKRFM